MKYFKAITFCALSLLAVSARAMTPQEKQRRLAEYLRGGHAAPAPAVKRQGVSISFQDLLQASNNFNETIGEFPTSNNRIKNVAARDDHRMEQIEMQASGTRPILHSRVLSFINDFLNYKRRHGSQVEKEFYATMNQQKFIDRLLRQRPLVFYMESDVALLRSANKCVIGGFENIGTDHQVSPLLLHDYLSYDEMQISALLGVSTPTYFINNGNRTNDAEIDAPGTYQESGIYVGLVGARFENKYKMESQCMLITKAQNTIENGYGLHKLDMQGQASAAAVQENIHEPKLLEVWERFYEQKFPTFQEAAADTAGKYIFIRNEEAYLNLDVYKKRLKMVVLPFLFDANNRGIRAGKNVYCHVVGLGIGVWAVDFKLQAQCMLEVYTDIILDNTLNQISNINFSWFPDGLDSQALQAVAEAKNIKIEFSKRNPADKLTGDDADKLLVAMYAWDGGSFPGNEYWGGSTTASGDPAAACCSTITELQNPYINPNVSAQKLATYGN